MINIIRVICGALEENAYIVYRDDSPRSVVIDPGDDLEALEKAFAQTEKTPGAILLTHGHFDHILAAAPLKTRYGAEVYIHSLDAHRLMSASDAMMNEAFCRLSFEPLTPDKLYPAGAQFELNACGLRFTGLHTPGHTPGGVCLLCDEGHALFTGDTLFANGYGRYDFPGGDVFALMASIWTILGLDRSLMVYPGHGDSDSLANIAAKWRK